MSVSEGQRQLTGGGGEEYTDCIRVAREFKDAMRIKLFFLN